MLANEYASLLFIDELEKNERYDTIFDFRRKCKKNKIMVTTDGILHGLHFPAVGIIINLGLPNLLEDYVQRITLGGRFGNKQKLFNIQYFLHN